MNNIHDKNVKKLIKIFSSELGFGDDECEEIYKTYKNKSKKTVDLNHIDGNDAQFAKADMGKDPISLVPPEILRCCAKIRAYGVAKYHTPSSWVLIEKERYVDAMMRHLLSYLEGDLVDDESGLPHLWHAACNMAFICEMEKPDWPEIKKRYIDSDPILKKELEKLNANNEVND